MRRYLEVAGERIDVMTLADECSERYDSHVREIVGERVEYWDVVRGEWVDIDEEVIDDAL